MTDASPKRNRMLAALDENLTHKQKNLDMSGRGRNRGSNRNTTQSIGEEVTIWEEVKTGLKDFVTDFNVENRNLNDLVALDKQAGTDPDNISNSTLRQMEDLCRSGVKAADANLIKLKELTGRLQLVRAVIAAQASENPAPSKRGTTRADSAAASASVYDFDGTGDSSQPSPISSGRKFSERPSRGGDRDSIPPKADSVEPQARDAGTPGGSSLNKTKVVFAKGDAVAFKPKAANGDQTQDWILGEVAQVMGEGKSRRYKVLDVEPDDQSKQKEYRSSASMMIPITPESQASTLKDWESGKVVLALYPQTTTFYKAEVHSMDDDGKVNLKFEGENDSSTLQQVERRFVIEYRA